MSHQLCTASHRDNPPTALGGLLLCGGHLATLTEALTGPSAADDPTVATAWGYPVGTRVIVCDGQQRATELRTAARHAWIRRLPTLDTHNEMQDALYTIPGPVVCGDGTTWLEPSRYRPGGLARLYSELADRLAGITTGEKIRGGTTVDVPDPAPDPVAELRSQIRHDLAYWVTTHIDAGNPIAPERDAHPAILTAWLAVRLDWAAAQDWAGRYADVLGELLHRGRRLIDLPHAPRTPAGICPEHGCGGALWSAIHLPPRLPVIRCEACGTEWDSTQWIPLRERLGRAG